jgi:hypothetical protein
MDLQVRADALASRLHNVGDRDGANLIYELRTKVFEQDKRIRQIRLLI